MITTQQTLVVLERIAMFYWPEGDAPIESYRPIRALTEFSGIPAKVLAAKVRQIREDLYWQG